MKILHVIPIFSPPQLFGGSQRVVHLISEALAKRGHEVVIFTSDMKSLEHKTSQPVEMARGVTIVHFKSVASFLSKKTRFIITPGMSPSLEKNIEAFDVVHLHEARSYQHIILCRVARKRGIPYVVQPHGNLNERFGGLSRKIYDKLFGTKILEEASKVIALNTTEARDCIKFGVSKEQLEVIPNPIDLNGCDDHSAKGVFRERYNIKPNCKIILFMGRIHPVKGVDLLIHAFSKMSKQSDLVATLVVAGPDDGYLKECLDITKRHNLNNVVFTGQLDDEERMQAYIDADLVAIPSRYEIFGMSALEACLCNKPVVASKVGGLEELVLDGKTGVLVRAGNIEELSNALTHVLSSDHYQNTLKKSRSLLEQKYSLDFVLDREESLYRRIS